jgi:hypothetical protein
LGLGIPRVVEARDDADLSRVPAAAADAGIFEYIYTPLVSRQRILAFAPAVPRGGVLKVVRGVLPVETAGRREDLATVADLGKAEGKTTAGEAGLRLTIQRVQNLGPQATVWFTLDDRSEETYRPTTHSFELTDGRGRVWRTTGYSVYPVSLVPPPVAAAGELGLLGAAPGAGFPGGLPWGALAARTRDADRRWGGNVLFSPPEKTDLTTAKLTFYRYRRLRAEVPFEFHDLPLP